MKRLPPFKSDGTVVKTKMDEKGVVKYFELERSVTDMSFKMTKSSVARGKQKTKEQ